jgi:hypothetical protein
MLPSASSVAPATTYTKKAVQERGFNNVYNITVGMAGSSPGPGWVQRRLSLQDCQRC